VTTARAKLETALITLASIGGGHRCQDPIDHESWTSEDQHDQDIAAAWSGSRVVGDRCAAAAIEPGERHVVWGATTHADLGWQRPD